MGKNYNWLVGFAAGMGGFLFGYEMGVIGQILGMKSFKDYYNIPSVDNPTAEQEATKASFETLMTCTFLAGCFISAGAFSMISDIIGRKYSIVSSGLIFAVGGLFQALASTVPVLVVGRVVSGVAVGAASMVVPMYIAETAPAATRGALTTIYQLMITFGIFIATCVNAGIISAYEKEGVDLEWRLALGMQVIPALLLVVAVYFIPFSPRWLAEKGRNEEGQQSIAKLRGLEVNDPAVIREFGEIREGIEYEQTIGNASWVELSRHGNPRRILLGVVNQIFQQFTGINVILYYSASIFSAMGFEHTDTLIAFPLANTFVNFVATFPGMWAVDKYGRKPLLVYGGAVMAIAHVLVYTFLKLSDTSSAYAWGAIFSVYLFLIAFASTWGPVVWSYQAEIFPLRIRAKATGLSTMTNWLFNLIVALMFPFAFAALNKQPIVYFIFAGFCVLMCAWAYFMVPETKGLTLEEIDEVFGVHHEKPMSPTELELAKKYASNVVRTH